MSNCQDAITELLWNLSMDSYQDEEIGSTEEHGWYALFRGPLYDDQIDRHNEIITVPGLWLEHGYRELVLKAADILAAMTASGFIVEQHSSGAVYSTVYADESELNDAWVRIEESYKVEECPECGAEAEEYGAGNPIVHEDGCEIAAEDAAA